MRRREFTAGGLTAGFAAPAHAAEAARLPLPGGGTIAVPRDYAARDVPQPTDRAARLFRNLRTNMGGIPVCDGCILVAGPGQFLTWEDFAQFGRNELTSGWQSVPILDPRSRWVGDGRERWRAIPVTIVGFWRVYDAPATHVLFERADGLRIQVWIFDRHGGLGAARRLAQRVDARL